MSKKYLESIKLIDGELYHLEYHQKRVESVVGRGIYRLQDMLVPPSEGLYRCRILYDAISFDVEYLSYQKRKIQTFKLIHDDFIEYSKKYAERSPLENLLQHRAECDDIIIVKNGLLTDTSIANIAFFDGERWLTPKTPLLQGTTRERLLDEGKIEKRDIGLQDIQSFKKIALMNAMIDFDIIAEENQGEIIC